MPEGIGKSGYISHVLADTYGYLSCKDKERLKVTWLKQEERFKANKWPTAWEAAKSFIRYLPGLTK